MGAIRFFRSGAVMGPRKPDINRDQDGTPHRLASPDGQVQGRSQTPDYATAQKKPLVSGIVTTHNRCRASLRGAGFYVCAGRCRCPVFIHPPT
jgi:hypothetical protein